MLLQQKRPVGMQLLACGHGSSSMSNGDSFGMESPFEAVDGLSVPFNPFVEFLVSDSEIPPLALLVLCADTPKSGCAHCAHTKSTLARMLSPGL